MKYLKVYINLGLWHLIPYKINHSKELNKTAGGTLIEYGFLCFKVIITYKK